MDSFDTNIAVSLETLWASAELDIPIDEERKGDPIAAGAFCIVA